MGGLYTQKNRSIPVAVYGLSRFSIPTTILGDGTYAIVGKCSTYGLVRNRFFRERVSFRIWNVGSSTYMPHTVNPVVDIIPTQLGLTVILPMFRF